MLQKTKNAVSKFKIESIYLKQFQNENVKRHLPKRRRNYRYENEVAYITVCET